MFGFIKRLLHSAYNLPWIISDYKELKKQLKNNKDFQIKSFLPIANEKSEWSAALMHFYFYQDLYVAQKVFEDNPKKHLDIGSRIDGFIAHIASFRKIEMFDIRPLKETIKNVQFTHGDLLDLETKYHNYADSISSLSVLEHFGLGRYGDKIDVDGTTKGIKAIHSMLKEGGLFYFSVPVGPQQIVFNAHRIFSMKYLLDLLKPLFEVLEFSYVDDKGEFFENAALIKDDIENNFWCQFGNGIFVLKKK